MPDSMGSPMGTPIASPMTAKTEVKPDLGAIQHSLSSAPLSGEVQALEQWFSGLAQPERLAVLYTLSGHLSDAELHWMNDILLQRRTSQDDKFGVFDRLVRDSAREQQQRSPLRLPPQSPMRPYIGKQDHFSQAFLRPQSFNPWPMSQEITRPKSATDWWPNTKPQPVQPISRPQEKHHSDSEEPVRRFRASHHSSHHGSGYHNGHGDYKKPVNFMDPELLADIGSWLRSLRLHKYTENLAGMPWQQVVQLNDRQLEERGVNALGARRKMLKMFEEIRAAQEAGKLPN